jgi:hypothetical protein
VASNATLAKGKLSSLALPSILTLGLKFPPYKTVKTLTLNIGLDRNDGGNVPLHFALITIANRFDILDLKLAQSETERTIVCRVSILDYGSKWTDKLHEICDLLDQDCIAVFDGKQGELIGPNAAKWGQFNPEFFINF